jgi:hypothetical protein
MTNDADDDSERIPLAVDAYGFKVNVQSRPDELGEQVPLSWKEVPKRVNQHLMRIAVAPTRLIAEGFEAATRFIRGVGKIPNSVARRMERAHVEADANEAQRQERVRDKLRQQQELSTQQHLLSQGTSDEDSAESAISQIQAILRKYKTKGVDAYVVFTPDGKPVLVLGTPPGSEQQVLESIEHAKALLAKPPENVHTE